MADPTTWTNVGSASTATSLPASNLTPGQAYDFEVVASNTAGTATSAVLTATTGTYVAPSAPGTPTIGTVTSSSVTLAWTVSSAGSAPINYQPQFRITGQTAWQPFGSASGSTSATITGLLAGTSYDFSVAAINPGGTTLSGVVSAATIAPAIAPAAPTGLQVLARTTTSLTVGWTASASGTLPIAYQCQYRLSGTTNTWVPVTAAGAALNATVTGLTPGVSYDFQVIASGPGGTATSVYFSADTPIATVGPDAPGNLTITAITTTSASLSWSGSTVGTQPISYQPQYRVSGTIPWSTSGQAVPGLSATVSGLSPGKTYDFQVVAQNAIGSAASIIQSAATLQTVVRPSAPGGLTPWIITPTSVSLTWTASQTGSAPIAYQPQYRQVGSGAWLPYGGPVAGTAVTIGGLTPGLDYDFQVLASNAAGSAPSQTLTILAPITGPNVSHANFQPRTVLTAQALDAALDGKLDAAGGSVGPLSSTQTGGAAPLPSQITLARTAGGAGDAAMVSGSYTAAFRDGPSIAYGAMAMSVTVLDDGSGYGPAGAFSALNGHLTVGTLRSTANGGGGNSVHAAIVGQADRSAPAGGVPNGAIMAEAHGARLGAADHTSLPSSQGGSLSGVDIAVTANGLDDAGLRYGVRLTYGEDTGLASGGQPADFSAALAIVPTSPTAYAHTIVTVGGKYSSAAIDLRGATAPSAKITSSTPSTSVNTVSVDNALAFASAGPYAAPTSGSNPKNVTINGNAYRVSKVSVTPGLASGVLTFAAPVNAADAALGTTIVPESHGIWLSETGGDVAFNLTGTTRAYADPTTGALTLVSAAGAAPVIIAAGQSLRLPAGTSQQRPALPAFGDIRPNADLSSYEVYIPGAGWANIVTTASSAGVPPGAATGLVSGTPSSGAVALSWTAPTTGTTPFSYQVQYRVSGTSGWIGWGGAGPATSTTVTGLSAGTRYDFQVLTINGAGSTPSAVTSVTMPAVAPNAPTGLTLSNATSTTITASWTASTTGTTPISYTLYWRTTGSPNFFYSSAPVTGTSVTATGLTAGQQYDFEVIASNTAGTATSSVVSATTAAAATVAPSAPTSVVTSSPTANSLVVSWTAPASGSTPMSYQPAYRVTGTSSWIIFNQPIPGTTVTLTGLSAATSYDVQVTATNSAGSATSTPVAVGVTTAAPVASSGSVAGSQTSGATNPVINGPLTGSVVVSNLLPITGITISDPGAATAAGSCTLVMSCSTGTVSSSVGSAQVAGSGSRQITYSNTLSACQTAAADLVYTAPASAASDTIVVLFTDQGGASHQISIAVSVTASTVSGGSYRDPALQPFVATSPWNLGVGSSATWSASGDADTVDLVGGPMYINAGSYSIPVYTGTQSDPLTTVTCVDTVFPVPPQKIRIPANATPANPQDGSATDGQMVFFDRTQPGYMWCGGACVRNADGSITCQTMQVDNVCSDLVTHDMAVGGTNVGVGLIRLWELQAGSIQHALRFSLPVNRVKSPGGSWDVGIPWPNGHEDYTGPTDYTGHVVFGSTIGIPATVNLATLGLSSAGMVIGKALQNYGAIMRDTGGASSQGPILYAEQAAEGNAVLTAMRADLPKLLPYLRVMRNQGSGTPNGGGTYPTPVAQLDIAVCPVGGNTGVIPSDSTGERAKPAQSMLNGFGVNTHIDNAGYQAVGLATIENCINYLGGIKLLRDSAGSSNDSTWWPQVAQACGTKFIAYIPIAASSAFNTLLNNIGGVPSQYLAAFEGCQEADTGQAAGYAETLSQAASFQQTVWAAGQQYGLPVIQMSFGQGWDTNPNTGNYGTVGNLSAYATYGNAHSYLGGAPAGPNGGLSDFITAAQLATPNKPVAFTECGWRQVVQSGYGCVSQATAATYLLQFIVDAFLLGSPYYVAYELLDDQSVEAGQDYGLFTDAGTPKPAATAIRNFFTLLGDSGSNATTFSPGLLNYTLTNMPAVNNKLGGGHLLLQKSDGSFWLALWNEQLLNNTNTGADVAVAPVNVTLSFPSSVTAIAVYDPVSSQTAVQSASAVSTLTISLPARVILVKIVK